ncbi:MAG: hypothetical protein IKU37_03090 [Candidatus Gastranaerophilales bacterium]|nr:hypothetical protein [Candidatus Gastranaerophilales bacterium]
MLAKKQYDSDFVDAFGRMIEKISDGVPFSEASVELKSILPHSAAIKQTSLGTAVMAEGWKKPIVFPSKGSFKFAGWIDNPKEVNTKELWEAAYGVQPPLIFGAVGNSNIKPEQVNGGCSLTKQELSQKYEGAIKDFYQPIIAYLKEQGAKSEDIGFAFAHSDCGVDRAAREITETNNLRGFAVTSTRYTQYLRGKEMPACEEFPNGFIMADFPFPTVLTRDMTQIDDYARAYGIMVGKKNPLGVFGGGEHAFVRDAKEAFIGTGAAEAIPVDIMRDKFGIVIPATNEKGVVTNAARDMIERINGNPYEQFRYAFKIFLPDSGIKNDIAQYDPQLAITTIAYAKLAQAGKIGK